LLLHQDQRPAPDSSAAGWLAGAGHMLMVAGAVRDVDGEAGPLRIAWQALQRPGVAARFAGDGPLATAADVVRNRWLTDDQFSAHSQRTTRRRTITSGEAAELLGLADGNSATQTLRRWGVATAPRVAGQGHQTRYYHDEVTAAAARRPGRGARTDLRSPSTTGRPPLPTTDQSGYGETVPTVPTVPTEE
jgi:hypothetical protein